MYGSQNRHELRLFVGKVGENSNNFGVTAVWSGTIYCRHFGIKMNVDCVVVISRKCSHRISPPPLSFSSSLKKKYSPIQRGEREREESEVTGTDWAVGSSN